MTKIVSVQDISCYGSCSTTVALPILTSRGIETAILPTALLSSHTGGFKSVSCLDLTEEMDKIIDCWIAEGLTFDAIYTGYISNIKQFDAIRRLRGLLKSDGQLFVDPAMADHGKLYRKLDENIVEGHKRLIAEADLVLPNLTELHLLTDHPYKEDYSIHGDRSLELRELVRELAAKGPSRVVVTGINEVIGDVDYVSILGYDGVRESFCGVSIPAVKRDDQSCAYHGTGDIFSSVTIAALLNDKPLAEAITEAASFVAKAIRETIEDRSHDYGVKFEKVLIDN